MYFKGQVLIFIKIECMEGLRAGQHTSGSNKRHHHKGRHVGGRQEKGCLALQLLGRSLSAKLPPLALAKIT